MPFEVSRVIWVSAVLLMVKVGEQHSHVVREWTTGVIKCVFPLFEVCEYGDKPSSDVFIKKHERNRGLSVSKGPLRKKKN